jgi:hypothetical protein
MARLFSKGSSLVPQGAWLHLLVPLVGASFGVAAPLAWAQETEPSSTATAESRPELPATLDAQPAPDAVPAKDEVSTLEQTAVPEVSFETTEVDSAESAAEVEAGAEVEAETPTTPSLAASEASETLVGVGNDEVLEMAAAQFSDSTIIAVIAANTTRFDISPRSLVALKSAGVSERVIEAMLEAEAANDYGASENEEPEQAAAAAAAAQAAQEYAKLTEMVERLAAQQQAAAAAQQEAAAAAQRAAEATPRANATPRAWIVGPADRTPVAPTIAQVGFADGGNKRGERFRTLQGLAGQALAFASPAASGIATTLGSLFRTDEERTAVWALAASASSRVLGSRAVFEIDYAHIPGVDPDRYQPAIVLLVPTNDNYRLVAAAETEGSNAGSLPKGQIIEELVPTEVTRLDRGRYRVAPRTALHPGEYALVLRPVPETARQRRRNKEASLGELLGGGTTQILYLTWDFSVEPPADR